ncbi:MAG: CidA/LrgA family protein [Muribaculaceae bacterium]|uniref:CidA/LrgA family protein n=1 Tax=uncultured Muribaculum sp. TaxID=1918613 RepID=UPI0026EDC934|nr:CidA/LrgA family protein [uncultured Muribaculum sp.]
MIVQFGILFAFVTLGELVVWLTGWPVPSSIIGMILLTTSLKAGVIKLNRVERLSDFLTHNLGFFFVPAGVGLMNCLGIISEQWLPIIAASVVSTVVIIAVTGWTHRLVRKSLTRKKQQNTHLQKI